MKQSILLKTLAIFIFCTIQTAIYAQEQQPEKSPEELATEEANRLEELLNLEPHQTFYIDSVLQHDMRGMYDEMQVMRESATQEYIVYQRIKEKWTAKIDSAYVKILTEKQWMEYLRSTNRMTKEIKKEYKKKYGKKK